MNINKWLCKHMDFGEKGYVTLWDIVKGTFYISVFAIVATLFAITSVYIYFHRAALVIWGDIMYGDMISIDDMVCVTMFMFINAVIILAGAAIIAHKLASIRVVTCELKEGDDTDGST